MNELKKIANQWFDAFNAHDIDALINLYDDNAEHYSPKLKLLRPETNGLISGKAALRNWWVDAFNGLPQLNYQVLQLTAEGNQVFMEYIRRTTGEDDLRVGEVLSIRNGKIIASRVYHS